MPILATEVSRAFVPPCTRADISRAAALGPDEPLGGTGTLATNSAANEAMVVPPQNPRSGDAANTPAACSPGSQHNNWARHDS